MPYFVNSDAASSLVILAGAAAAFEGAASYAGVDVEDAATCAVVAARSSVRAVLVGAAVESFSRQDLS